MRKARGTATALLTGSAVMALTMAPGTPLEAQTQAALEIPLREAGGRLAVEVEGPDGETFTFALSTGTAVTVLTESTAQLLGQATELAMSGVAISLDGAHTLSDEALAGDDVSYDGMIGVGTLSDYDVLVDLANGRMLLQSPGRSVAWTGVTLSDPVPLRVLHGVVLALEVEVDGGTRPATLDLGAAAIVVNEGLGLGPVGTRGTLTLGLGETSLRELSFEVGDDPILDRWDPEGRGFVIVGASIARDCPISISWVHAELRTCVR